MRKCIPEEVLQNFCILERGAVAYYLCAAWFMFFVLHLTCQISFLVDIHLTCPIFAVSQLFRYYVVSLHESVGRLPCSI